MRDRTDRFDRIADEQNRFRSLRHCKHVGKRHLCSFVYKQHIDGFESIRPRPEPGCSGPDLGGASVQRVEQVFIALREREAMPDRRNLISFLAALEIEPQIIRGLNCVINQVPDYFMTISCDSDLLPAADQLTDHPCTDESLPCSRRSLYRKNASS